MSFSVFNPCIFMSFVAILSILMSLFQGRLEALFIRMTQEQTHTHTKTRAEEMSARAIRINARL